MTQPTILVTGATGNTGGAIVSELLRNGTLQGFSKDRGLIAVAALYYIEPTLTEDLDILISISHFDNRPSGLLLLGPIETALAKMGYTERKDVG